MESPPAEAVERIAALEAENDLLCEKVVTQAVRITAMEERPRPRTRGLLKFV